MRNALLAALLLIPAVSFAQATPGGVYRAPGNMESWSYEPHHKDRFTVEVVAPTIETDRYGRQQQTEKVIGQYSITDSQWAGMKKNVEKFCRQKNLKVAKIDPVGTVTIYLVSADPPNKKGNPLDASRRPTKSVETKSVEPPSGDEPLTKPAPKKPKSLLAPDAP